MINESVSHSAHKGSFGWFLWVVKAMRYLLILGLIQKHDRALVHSKRWFVVGALFTLLVFVTFPANSQSPPDVKPAIIQPLRIATRLLKPDAFKENGRIVGFSADLGQGILKQLQREAVLKPYANTTEVLNAIRLRQADVGIAAIAITSRREQEFDFSYPIFSGGLQIMVLAKTEQGRQIEQEVFRRLLDPNLLRLVSIIALLTLIPVHILWYFERHNKDGLIENPAYIPGIFQALWWSLLALVGQADEMPQKPVGRIVALFWVFVGVVFVSSFTAIITAELTVQEIQGNIRELGDLQSHRVALVADGEALDYLQSHNVQQVTAFPQLEQAYQALLTNEVDAIVAPRPLLLYYASHERQGKVQVVGAPFRDQFYSIVMPKDSVYRRPINRSILTLKENGTYREIYRKWFGTNPQD